MFFMSFKCSQMLVFLILLLLFCIIVYYIFVRYFETIKYIGKVFLFKCIWNNVIWHSPLKISWNFLNYLKIEIWTVTSIFGICCRLAERKWNVFNGFLANNLLVMVFIIYNYAHPVVFYFGHVFKGFNSWVYIRGFPWI